MTDTEFQDTPRADGPEPPLDRTISPIAGPLSGGRRGKALAFAGLLAGCGVFAFASWSADRPKPEKAPDQPARQVVAFEPAKAPPTLATPGAGAPSLAGSSEVVPAIATDSAQPAPPKGGVSTGPSALQQVRAAPVMAYSRSAAKLDLVADGIQPLVPALTPDGAGGGTELDQLRSGSKIGRATARRLGDRNFLILAGATIPCVLQTALDSSTSGYATCLISSDVYSDNGGVVLLDKGTRVLGEYRGGLRQGQRRIFVLWTRAVTPGGVAIDLASPASDALGRSGFDGQIDTHFWDRFGAALLLSVVDDGAYAIAGRDSRNATARLPSDAAGLAVQNNADIPPTLRKAQGAEVAILAAQDFDFSGVYGLKARAP
ncbi:MAG: type IV secretion system protein VirB10 [Alphaproteobacteria bacterium]|nr:type IV secretion system protein VirB10 [Alphaproteobacteria bacterium]MBU1516574.1 type IV secretion system protein VirB10 [Alphaproteobacteria bacterium]MBU2094331.1 type IV secretion system protein VirB10 [Alphaproteobacteria bacterium]MBU2154092.1 type IV secretion system protein VirB10 [Alphaproteobacteria bacterium]MBU2307501.1 type IV secretion system protein VirB10 [Alphaproteobacteria bacterium]